MQVTADVYGHLFPQTNDLVIGRLDRALRDALRRSDEQLTTGDTQPVTDRSRHDGRHAVHQRWLQASAPAG